MPVKRLAVATTVLLVAACAPKPWVKEGATAERVQEELRACQAQAYAEVQKRYAALPHVGPALITDATSRRLNAYPSGAFTDVNGTQLQDENLLTAECMREKGYQQK
jgi:hypothetical protein